jgi:hypothetical protein
VAPVISHIEILGQRGRIVVGGAEITIVGARLHECSAASPACEHPDVRVSIDGKACTVLSAATDRLRVLVPADASSARSC